LNLPKEKDFKESRLILAYDKTGIINLGKNGFVFPSVELFPREIIRMPERFGLIIESLAYENEQMGFVIYEINPREGIRISSMNDQIRSAVKVLLLFEDTKEKEKKLETALSESRKNHEKLEEAYEQLKANQETLLLSEKMASLGRLTTGIAHEMNSPLSVIGASMDNLSNLINEYKDSIGNESITQNDHMEIAEDMIQIVKVSKKAIENAMGFIRGIKSHTRQMKKEDGIYFNAVETINESVLLLSHSLKQNNVSLEFGFSNDSIMLYGMPGRLSQVITNLVINAIDAMHDKGGVIRTNLSENEKEVLLIIEDNGCGIHEDIVTKIFEPLFTTKPVGQGTGLGLSIVHEIVYGEFNGTIKVTSKVGSGTVFSITFVKRPN
jgi:C4-dicarboxylate-specific signal transduction histidine kinase